MPEAPAGALIAERYEVLRALGQGSFGQTYLARDTQADRPVAIKLLDSRTVQDWKGFELFQREADVLRSVRHQGVPTVHDAGRARWNGVEAAFLVMEYIEGTSLREVIEARHHLDPAEASHILLELLGVLDHLHTRVPPILHRDIKPANIILRHDGSPVLVDFGAVRNTHAGPAEEGSTIVGTYGYMPYEQHMGRASASSDLYALAATHLHLLTGRRPPEFMNDAGRIEVPPDLPGGDRQRLVLARMLHPSPEERFQRAREVRQALLATESGPAAAAGALVMAAAAPTLAALPDLPPAPRPLTDATAARYRQLAPTALLYMNEGERPEGFDLPGTAMLVFFSLITAGILPMVFWSRARARRRKLRRFLQEGVPAVARITEIREEKVEFDVKLTRVRYEWEAGGQLRRDSDEAFAPVSDKWRVGDTLQILYLPERDHDSVIISTS